MQHVIESIGELNSEFRVDNNNYYYYNIPMIINEKKLSGRFACKSFSLNYVNKYTYYYGIN